MDLKKYIKDFPLLKRKIKGKRIVYLDNAATSQKPKMVIDAIKNFYEEKNSNVHRGIYKISEEATDAYENARTKVSSFINSMPEEVIFTSGTTDAINILASKLPDIFNGKDEILLTEMEHHSNLVPWQEAAKRFDLKIKYIPITDEFLLDYSKAKSLISKKTALVSITHISNTLGTVNDVRDIVKLAKDYGAFTLIDAAQSVPHTKVDFKELDVDFLAFSGHKMLGPTGIGCLVGKKKCLEKLNPSKFGGGMISRVSLKETSFAQSPNKFEAGTPNIAGAIGLATAITYIESIGLENIEKHELELRRYALEKLKKIEDFVLYTPKDGSGIISFNIKDVHPHDVTSLLDDYGICVRAGHHCTMPLMEKLNIPGTCRASFYLYNTTEDIDLLVKALAEVKKVFKK